MGALIWLIENWKILVAGVLTTVVFVSGCTVGTHRVQGQWDSEKAKLQKEAMLKSEQDAKKILDLETTKNENEKRIDGLLANNHALWLRLPKTPCPKPADTGVSEQPPTGGGSLYSIAPDPLEEYSREVGELFGQCDKIVESCRVNADYLKSLHK